MKKIAIGSVLRTLVSEKNFSVDQVAKAIGKSRQQVYNDFNRMKMKDDEIEKYSLALGVDKTHIYSLIGGGEDVVGLTTKESNYLLEHLASLEEQFKRLLNQLETKDRQIERLMDLLGKLDLGGDTPWGKVLPMPSKEAA